MLAGALTGTAYFFRSLFFSLERLAECALTFQDFVTEVVRRLAFSVFI
jgi:hypothetical protein